VIAPPRRVTSIFQVVFPSRCGGAVVLSERTEIVGEHEFGTVESEDMSEKKLLDEKIYQMHQWSDQYSVRDTLRLLTNSLKEFGLRDWALKNDNSQDPLRPEITVTGTFQIAAQKIRRHLTSLGMKVDEKNEFSEHWVWRPKSFPDQQLDAKLQFYGRESKYAPVNTVILRAVGDYRSAQHQEH
jgi:hypothetical protein